jgi:methylenetetrahydrofolate dehydrogenase (NADP+)/methenyltetrahydrofolate cyclohydrolase
MAADVIKGIEVVKAMKQDHLARVRKLRDGGLTPCMAIVRIGAREDDLAYERTAVNRCERTEIDRKIFEFSEDVSSDEFIESFMQINNDDSIHGIMLFRPFPKHIDEKKVLEVMKPEKDIDGMTDENLVKIFKGDETGFAPCTAEAVIRILDFSGIDLTGKNVALIGRSLVVGKPLMMMLIKRNATVTVCHTRTEDIASVCKKADIVIAAAGQAKMVSSKFVGAGAIVIDVGINVDEMSRLCGDVDFDNVSEIAGMITPVPGGVGTVTTALLAEHVIKACEHTCK